MKRFLAIFLAAVMILSTFATTIVDVAATTTPAEEIYLSDITPTSWKIIDGCTPGYNAYYEDGTPLILAGVTYEKGLSTHPGFTHDAEFVYDISAYDHTAFTAIVGKTDRYVAALPGSLTSFHVYVDGVLADEVIDLVAGETYTFDINVAGASELKLITGGGSDNITCDGSIWADAKLSYDKVEPVDPPVDPEAPSDEELYLSDTTPTSWKMYDGCTPGYNVYFEDGTPLVLAGVTYEKGLSTHPGGGFDAEFVYDISGYDYTTFTAIVGKTDRYVAALPGSFTSFHVYIDEVLADEVFDLVAGETYTFRVNVAGASELKLVTGGGSDNITCDGSIWADAKLNYDKVDPADPPADPETSSTEELYLSDITPTGWKMFEGCTPGYDIYYEDGSPLRLAGVTYKKGLSTHPAFTYDAEFVYDISAYDYTVFTAIVGKTDRYVAALPGSFTSFHVYVDGVLADEVIDLVAGETYTFNIDVAGASELKLVTGGGSDNVTCDGSIWANTKLFMGVYDCGEHNWVAGKVLKDPSCTEVGQMKYRCTNCVQVKTEDISVVPHTAGAWVMGEKASCTEAGTKVQTCSECGEIMDTTVWDAKGHTPGAWVTTKSATCTEAGKKAQTCQVCDTVLAEKEIPALGHFFGDWGIVDGQQVRICECGEQEVKVLSVDGGYAPLLYVGVGIIILLAAGAVAFLLIRKKRQGE